MKISLRRALELAVGPANVDAAGHAVADWFDSIDWNATANRVREALRDQPASDVVPHNRPDTSLRAELLQKLATQREVILSLRQRVERLERRWAKETAGGDKLDRLIAQDREADGPAVSEDREPAAVVEEPTDAELLELYPLSMTDLDDAFAFARAVLARWGHQPAPPAEGEVGELVALIRQIALAWEPDACLLGNMTAGQLSRAAELLQQRHPEPVPVAIPGEDHHYDMGPVAWWRNPVAKLHGRVGSGFAEDIATELDPPPPATNHPTNDE